MIDYLRTVLWAGYELRQGAYFREARLNHAMAEGALTVPEPPRLPVLLEAEVAGEIPSRSPGGY